MVVTLESLLCENNDIELTMEDANFLNSTPPNAQMITAIESYGEDACLCEQFDFSMESADITFEGYSNVIKKIKFGVRDSDSFADVVKRLKESGGEKLVKALIPALKKDGYSVIKSPEEFKKYAKEYGNNHPIRSAFTSYTSLQHKWTANSGWLGLLQLICSLCGIVVPLDQPVNGELVSIGGTVVFVQDYLGWTKRLGETKIKKNRGGAPSGCFALFWNPDKKLFRMVCIARQKFIDFNKQDKEGKVK